MILQNPENGATIKTAINGKEWFFPKGTIQRFPEEVARELVEKYGFLKEFNEIGIEEVGEEYKCSACGYQNKVKIAVLGHLKSHGEIVEAKPVGEAKKRLGLLEARALRTSLKGEEGLPQIQGVEYYGEGLEETRGGKTTKFTGAI